MKSQNIILFGGSGFLGSRILSKNKRIISPLHSQLDLLDEKKVYEFLEKSQPVKIIYSAGISRMDFAEKNKTLTNNLNSRIPYLIAKYSNKNDISFIYISSDAVFDGYQKKYKFNEIAKTNAKSTYGISKERGEYNVLSQSNNNTVVRIISLFGNNQNNFIHEMINNLLNNREFPGIVDQVNNPLNVDLAAKAILFITKHNLKGIYNLGALNADSNYSFLKLAAKELKLNEKLIKKISFEDFFRNKIAPRKKKSILLTEKFSYESNYSILKDLKHSISYLNLK